jgi:hypothetical protein
MKELSAASQAGKYVGLFVKGEEAEMVDMGSFALVVPPILWEIWGKDRWVELCEGPDAAYMQIQEDLQILKRQRELQDRRHRRYLEEQGLEEHVLPPGRL